MNATDTNIWVYSHDSRDPAKQQKAQDLFARVRPLMIPWQVGCEFIAASRKLRTIGFSEKDAWDALTDVLSFANSVIIPAPRIWPATRDLQLRYSLSFWDALLVATCIDGGVLNLYTEDMGAPRTIDTLNLINPFLVP